MEKHCSLCKSSKEYAAFNVSRNTLSGRCSRCRECESKVKKFRRANKLGYYASECYRKRRSKPNRRNKKLRVIEHYSKGTMKCASCSFTDVRALTVDHVNNDGGAHRKQIKKQNFYTWIILNGFPDGLQIPCMNCQFIKEYERLQALKTLGTKRQ